MSRKNRLGLYVFSSILVLLSLTSLTLPDVTYLSTDKPTYNRGETVTISGKASAGEWVAIQVNDPNGVPVWIDTVKAGGDGSFTSSFQLSSAAEYGTYTVYARPGLIIAYFRVGEVYVPPPPGKKSSSMSITLDKTLITLGEEITIKGSLTPALNTTVDLKITCPNGTEVSKSVSTSLGGFTHVFKPDVGGVWSTRASWAGNDEYYGCSSNTVTVIVRGSVILQITVAPLMTSVGGMIMIYVNTSPPLVDRPLMLSYITNKTAVWNSIGNFETSSGGIVACLFTPGETGKYMFKAEWIGDSVFMPASATSSEVLVIAEPLTVEDIINALNQLKALQELLKEKEGELKSCRDTVSGLQKNIDDLQRDLREMQSTVSDLMSRLAETEAKLSETELRLVPVTIIASVAGLLIGILIGIVIARAFFSRSEERRVT